TVQAFGQEENTQKRFDEVNDRLERCSLSAIFFSSLVNPSTRFVNALAYAGVGVTGALSVLSGTITIGGLSCFLS
ncbi:MAG: ABC transporter transmembrane domain-containing protein, partial [Oscillospiraceae bacterium]